MGVPASALFLYLAARGLELDEIRTAIAGADRARIGLGAATSSLVYGFQAARWRRIARR